MYCSPTACSANPRKDQHPSSKPAAHVLAVAAAGDGPAAAGSSARESGSEEVLDAVRAEANARVERSQQFVNMRQMLAKKNMLVRQMRETLQAHGIPMDDVDAQDD